MATNEGAPLGVTEATDSVAPGEQKTDLPQAPEPESTPGELTAPTPSRETEGAIELDGGSLSFADDIIEEIAYREAQQVDGIVALHGTMKEELLAKFRRGESVKGVVLHKEGGQVSLDISITVQYGVCIRDLAQELLQRVRGAIEKMTCYEVRAVNITVDGVEPECSEAAVDEVGKDA